MTSNLDAGENGKQPKIVAFTCNWGAYSAAEMAGVNHKQYSPSVRLIRLMCLGQLRSSQIIRAFELGADGVILILCPPSDCHYGFGNHQAEEAFAEARELIQVLGLEDDRLRLEWMPPGDANAFARALNTFVETVRQLEHGPLALTKVNG